MAKRQRWVLRTLLVASAFLLGVSLAVSSHGDALVAGVLAMAAATAIFIVGVLIGDAGHSANQSDRAA